jgi:tetratricopeptide (TPR) repeat protein
MSTIEFQKRKRAFEQCIDDTLSVFLTRQLDGSEYLDEESLAESHEQAWELLDNEHKKRIWELSSDLYSLTDNEKIPDASDPPNDQVLASMIQVSYEKQDWQELLRCFRFQPSTIPRNSIEYMRGRAWESLGFPRVALAFYDNASRIDPESPIYRYQSMRQVKELGDWEELQRRCELNSIELSDSATMQLLCGELYHDIAVNKSDINMDHVALQLLNRGFELQPHQTVREIVLASAVACKVFVMTNLQRLDETIPFLNSWIERLPKNAELRSTRGLVYLTRDYPTALKDFEAAIGLGTAVPLPYLVVAKSKLLNKEYAEAARLCQRGVQLTRRDALLAEFHHILGLAAFFMQDEQSAGNELNSASTFDPSNRVIRMNVQMLRNGSYKFTLPTEALRTEEEIAQLMSIH